MGFIIIRLNNLEWKNERIRKEIKKTVNIMKMKMAGIMLRLLKRMNLKLVKEHDFQMGNSVFMPAILPSHVYPTQK